MVEQAQVFQVQLSEQELELIEDALRIARLELRKAMQRMDHNWYNEDVNQMIELRNKLRKIQ
jgi:hypothetical protein